MSARTILAGDIGGTKTHLALYQAEGADLRPIFERSFASRDFATLPAVLEALNKERPMHVAAAAFGVAGPIVDNRSKLTNLGWTVDGHEVADCLKLSHVPLLNDLEAMAYGTLRLADGERVSLQKGERHDRRAIAVIAAGTGLGEGALVWDGKGYRAVPTEGGHSDFGPRNETEIDLLRFLTEKFGRVSYERIVCGPGLLNVYEFFRSRESAPEPTWLRDQLVTGDPAAVISRAGAENKDPLCRRALELMVSVYGAEAGNLALKFLATGGVFVGGGIAPKILPLLQQGSFMESFTRKGRYQALLERIPVDVVLNDKAALLGAAHYAAFMSPV